jgi:hypothetical protein
LLHDLIDTILIAGDSLNTDIGPDSEAHIPAHYENDEKLAHESQFYEPVEENANQTNGKIENGKEIKSNTQV